MADTTRLPIIPDLRGGDLNHLERVTPIRLNLIMAGNPFMIIQELVAAFRQQYPDVWPIYYQTLPVEIIEPGSDLDRHHRIGYYTCQLKPSPNPENAKRFLRFIGSDRVQSIYTEHGFFPHDE